MIFVRECIQIANCPDLSSFQKTRLFVALILQTALTKHNNVITNHLNQSLSLFQPPYLPAEIKNHNNLDLKQTAAAIKIQRSFRKYMLQNEQTKRIHCDSSHFLDIKDLWKNLTKIVKEEEGIQRLHLINVESSLIISINLIQTLLNAPTWSVNELFKRQEMILENGKLLLNGFERQLLIQESSYFKSLWSGNFKESQLNEAINIAIPKDHLEMLLDLLKLPTPKNNQIMNESSDESPYLLNLPLFLNVPNEDVDMLFKIRFLGTDEAVNWSLEELTSLLKTTNFLGMHKISQALEKEIIKKIESFDEKEKDFDRGLELWGFADENNCTHLKQVLEPYFSNCLKYDLTKNAEEILFIKHIKCLSELMITSIDLSFCNKLAGENFEALKELKYLRSINLSYCTKLTDQDLEVLRDLEHLRTLNLYNCYRLTDRGLEIIKDLKNLESLNLSHCKKLTDRGIDLLRYLKRLHSLSLNGCNHLTDEGFEFLKDLKRLQSLSLKNCNQLTDITVETLKDLKRLHSLNLAHCYRLTNKSLEFLENLKRLHSLNLSECIELTDEDFDVLKDLKYLRLLTVNHSNESETIEKGPKILRRLKNLRTFKTPFYLRINSN